MTTFPCVHLGDRIPIGQEPSATVPFFNVWSLTWTAQRLPHLLHGWWDAPIFWPSHGTYASSELQPLTGLGFALLRPAVGPAAAYGLLLLGRRSCWTVSRRERWPDGSARRRARRSPPGCSRRPCRSSSSSWACCSC